jgi:hypothetical protein
MRNTLLNARAVLESVGYRTIMVQPAATWFHFEDASVIGILHVTASLEELVQRWQQVQDNFLRDSAPRLALDPLKAWNCYTVLLTSAPGTTHNGIALSSIEEDFRGTRKIVRAGVATRPDVERALGALLPLRNILPLTAENLRARLADRFGGPGSPLASLLSDSQPAQVVASLLRPE